MVGKMLLWDCLVGRENWGGWRFWWGLLGPPKTNFPQFGEKMGEGRDRW